MTVKLVITGITNMKEGNICVSGYELSAKRYVRPLIQQHHLTTGFLERYNKKIQLGSVVEVDLVSPQKTNYMPHIEDANINPDSLKVVDLMSRSKLKELLKNISDKSLEDIYGNELELKQGQPVIPEGLGKRSLGAIVCRKCCVYENHLGKLRCDLIDRTGAEYRNIPVVARDEYAKRKGQFENIPIRMGLSRLWKKEGDDESFFWVHVSAIFT